MNCNLKKKKESVVISVYVKAGAKKNEILGFFDGRLKVKIAAPPVGGKANKELIAFLSKRFHIPASNILITSGKKSKIKLVKIQSLNKEKIGRYLGKDAKNDRYY
jgi:hypothetical protein